VIRRLLRQGGARASQMGAREPFLYPGFGVPRFAAAMARCHPRSAGYKRPDLPDGVALG